MESQGNSDQQSMRFSIPEDIESLIGIDELCRILDKPKSWIWERTRKGSRFVEMPHYYVGRETKYIKVKVFEYLSQTNGGLALKQIPEKSFETNVNRLRKSANKSN